MLVRVKATWQHSDDVYSCYALQSLSLQLHCVTRLVNEIMFQSHTTLRGIKNLHIKVKYNSTEIPRNVATTKTYEFSQRGLTFDASENPTQKRPFHVSKPH